MLMLFYQQLILLFEHNKCGQYCHLSFQQYWLYSYTFSVYELLHNMRMT